MDLPASSRFARFARCCCWFVSAALTAGISLRAAEVPSAVRVAKQPADYVLQPGDVIRIQVFQEPDLDRELPVSNGGLITGVPLLGAVPVRGLTVAQVEADIAARYNADFLVDPQITITVLRYTEQRVKVLGAVNAPGLVIVPPSERMSLIDAIARCGDFNRLADRRRVRVTRTHADGTSTNFVVDVDALRAGEASTIVWLECDDIVVVAERRI